VRAGCLRPFFRFVGERAPGARRCNEARALQERVGRAERPRRRDEVESLSNPTAKGGTDNMAKKAAKGAKKKGGKKR
jgi:hypothetical protein